MSGHIGHASSVKVQATPHYSKRVLNVQTKAESPTTRTVDNSSGAEDGDEDEDDEHPDKDEDENDKSNNEDEGNDEDEDNMGEDEDEDFEGECDDENKGRSRLERAAHVAHKHEQFWILDGNTVLEVGGVLFKLHRSRLVDQSSFFAGLLDDQDVHMDDSVVVESDEHGMVYHLTQCKIFFFYFCTILTVIHRAYYFTPPPFPVLAAILRAATALGFDTYRAFAVKVLENAWSSSLADLTTERKPNAVEVVTLARTCGIESVLKRAFYEMVRIAGYGLGDGELDGVDGEGFQEISRADERRLERMREHLISAWSQDAVRVDRSFVCPNQPKETIGNRDAWERRVHDSGLYDEYQFDPLCGLQALIDIKWDEDEGWCSCCVRARRDVWTKRRQRTWERIGVWMGLDN
ncbi:hypothetical protein DFH29DRAFT_804060 [Suillus ampliporus]|nr:hypothetical protein DFH29DRAFT_804060 [Suillus ampliporus]